MRTPIRHPRPAGAPLLRALCLAIVAGCAEDSIVTPPPPPPPPDKAVIILNTITTGSNPDGNGYLLVLDGANFVQLAPSAERELILAPGSHSLLLSDLAANCTPLGENPRSLTLGGGQRVGVTFQVDCPALSIVDIVIATTGVSIDPDGYVLSMDNTVLRQVAVLDQAHLAEVRPGFYFFRLSSVAGNCTVAGGSSRMVTVVEGQTLMLRFDVHCVPRTDDTPGEKLVVSSREIIGGDANLEIMNSDGTGRQRLTDNAGEEMIPEFSPDGNRILFVELFDQRFRKLVLFDRVQRQESALATSGVERAVWSPDGSRIAFSRQGRLFLMNVDGSAETALTTGFDDRDPYWSPDGARIAFTRGSSLYLVNTNGSNLRALAGDRLAGPWSPDGQRILATAMECITYYYYYCYYSPTATDLRIIDVASGAETYLTETPWQPEWSPVWSRDGSHVYFISAPGGNPDVYVITVASHQVANLTTSSAREEWVSLGTVSAPASAFSAGVSRNRRP